MSSSLSTLLKEARAQSGLTQEQLAKKAGGGLDANAISRAERGLDVPTDTQLKAIARITGVTQKSLLDAAKAARTPAAKKTASAAAKKSASAASAKKSSSTARKTTAAKKTSSAKKDEYTLTAAEKKLIDAYRTASAENKKLALNLLQGKPIEETDSNGLSSLLQSGLSSGFGGVLETLISGLGKR